MARVEQIVAQPTTVVLELAAFRLPLSLSPPFKSMVILTSLDEKENERRPSSKSRSSVNGGGGENPLISLVVFGAEQPLTGAQNKMG